MKFSLVYLVSHVLLSSVSNVIVPNYFLRLANDLDVFNAYPWGMMVWEQTRQSLHKEILKIE